MGSEYKAEVDGITVRMPIELSRVGGNHTNDSKILSEELFEFLSKSKDFFEHHGIEMQDDFNGPSFICLKINGQKLPLTTEFTENILLVSGSQGENITKKVRISTIALFVDNDGGVKIYFGVKLNDEIRLIDGEGSSLLKNSPRSNFVIIKRMLVEFTGERCTICRKDALDLVSMGVDYNNWKKNGIEIPDIDICGDKFTHKNCQNESTT